MKIIVYQSLLLLNMFFLTPLYSQFTNTWYERYSDPTKVYWDDFGIWTRFDDTGAYFSRFYSDNGLIDCIDTNNIIMIDYSWPSSSFQEYPYEDIYTDGTKRRLQIIKSTDGGVNWFNIKPAIVDNISNFHIYSLNFLSKAEIFVSGISVKHRIDDINTIDKFFPSITYSIDSGKTWNTIDFDTTLYNVKISSIINCKMFDKKKGFAVAQGDIGYVVLKTTNCWKTFDIIYYNETKWISSSTIYFNEEFDSTYIALTDTRNFVLYSKDAGTNWSSFQFNKHTIDYFKFLDKSNYLVLTKDSSITFSSEKNKGFQKIYKTSNGGLNWDLHYQNEKGEGISGLYCYDDSLYALKIENRLFITYDGGHSFVKQHIPSSIIKLFFLSKNNYYAVGRGKINDFFISSYPVLFYCRNEKKSLIPVDIRIEKLNKIPGNYVLDTTVLNLSWNKIDSADKYMINITGVDKLSISSQSNYLQPQFYWKIDDGLSYLTQDTVFKYNQIVRNLKYKVEVIAICSSKPYKTSIPAVQLFLSDSTLLENPIIIRPNKNERVKSRSFEFKWLPVDSAKYYNIQLKRNSSFKSEFPYDMIVKIKNYPLTSLFLGNLEPSSNYELSISAANDNDISNWSLINFSTESILSTTELSGYHSIPFPNPALSTTRISLLQEGDISVSAVDVLGRSFPLWSGFASAGEMELDVSTLSTGSYTLLINYGTKVEVIKLIKN